MSKLWRNQLSSLFWRKYGAIEGTGRLHRLSDQVQEIKGQLIPLSFLKQLGAYAPYSLATRKDDCCLTLYLVKITQVYWTGEGHLRTSIPNWGHPYLFHPLRTIHYPAQEDWPLCLVPPLTIHTVYYYPRTATLSLYLWQTTWSIYSRLISYAKGRLLPYLIHCHCYIEWKILPRRGHLELTPPGTTPPNINCFGIYYK